MLKSGGCGCIGPAMATASPSLRPVRIPRGTRAGAGESAGALPFIMPVRQGVDDEVGDMACSDSRVGRAGRGLPWQTAQACCGTPPPARSAAMVWVTPTPRPDANIMIVPARMSMNRDRAPLRGMAFK